MNSPMQDIRILLEAKSREYNNIAFIAGDPISIPHQYSGKEDIEIAGFLTALISWGGRSLIVSNGLKLMNLMHNKPHAFLMNAEKADLLELSRFYYRTMNGDDLLFLVQALRNVYLDSGGLEQLANRGYRKEGNIKGAIMEMRKALLNIPHLKRSEKHLANPEMGSAAKRINMFLRWMVRKDNSGVDFGIWRDIPASALMCPLDVHSGRVARSLGLLQRKQNDWKGVEELTHHLREFDPKDPVKYDFALFGMGIFEKRQGNS